MTQDSTMRIAGTITNNGVWKTVVSGPSTVEYNGAAQTVINPNGTTEGYSNLILSGSGTKLWPRHLATYMGILVLLITQLLHLQLLLTIGGNLVIGAGATFNTGNFNHIIKGDFDNSGIFNSAPGHSITLNGTTPQTLLGTSTTIFDELNH